MFGLFGVGGGGDNKKADTQQAVIEKPAAETTTSAAAIPTTEPKRENEQQSSGNLLMISNQKHRSFYERAARELLASDKEEIQLSALGNATPLAVAVALSLQDKNCVTISKIETKYVDFAPNENGRRYHAAPIHSSGVSITLCRHPDFKGTRIVPGHVFFCSKPTNDDFLAFHESPDLVFVSVNAGPADQLFTTPYGEALKAILNKSGHEDTEAHKKLQAYLFEESSKANQGIDDLKSIKFVGEMAGIQAYNPNLKAAFVRVTPKANKEDMTGTAFIEVFEDGKCPHNNEHNAALVHLIAPRGTNYGDAQEFLNAVELTATNLMTALCDYNGFSRRRRNGSPRLRKLAVARLGLFSCEPSMIHPKTNKSEVAKAILKGLNTAYHFGTAPRLQFVYDDEDVIKKVWLDQSAAEEAQVSDHIFRRSSFEQNTK